MMTKKLLTIICCLFISGQLPAMDFKGVKDLVSRRIPWLANQVTFSKLENTVSNADVFTLQTRNNVLTVAASSPAAAAMGINWYLKYYCHQSLSLQSTNLKALKRLPEVKQQVKQSTPFRERYSLNYCTVGYTMSFYKWKEWAYVLDWLALNGVNLALAPVGNEKVWDLTLQDFDFSKKEREAFIPGPAFSAWWLMGNLEGWGGVMSEEIMNQQTALQKNILGRMRELGIRPVMQGFYGMVPRLLKEKYPNANIIDQGKWAGGFLRPSILSPEDPLFAKMAASFYRHTRELYGDDFNFFGGDPFHEGGISKGVSLDLAGASIYREMEKAFPDATWVLQGWGGNPSNQIISKLDREKVLILDLMGESNQNWIRRKGYNGSNWILGSVNNFGENSGLYGKLELLATQPFKVLNTPEGKSLRGIGEIPEGYHNNPVLYDLIYDAAWQDPSFKVERWIADYVTFRYGKADKTLKAAWQIFLNTIYTSNKSDFQGAPESVFCARPSLTAEHARTWGGLKRNYDTKAFAAAVKQFSSVAGQYHGNANYRYDLIDLNRQLLANQAEEVYLQMTSTYKANEPQAFKLHATAFIRLLKLQDSLLQMHPAFSLNTWLQQAWDFGQTPEDKRIAIWNAKTQISYWGSNQPNTNLHDYANKEWGGLMKTLYLERWQTYIQYLNEKLKGTNPTLPDFFAMEKKWAEQPYLPEKINDKFSLTKLQAIITNLNN
jgi:alpha-N-acetylglucosaminidase